MSKKFIKSAVALVLSLAIVLSFAGYGVIPSSAKNVSVNATVANSNENGTLKIKYNDTYLSSASTAYNHSLATTLADISALMYNSGDAEAKRVLKKMGYGSYVHSVDTVGDGVTYSLAKKTAKIKKVKYDILFVAIRGTTSVEWPDNFNSGYKETTHKGFGNAADKLYKDIKTYVKKNKLKKKKNTKIVITGHSRGGAVANLLAKKINESGIGSIKPAKKNIYAYTFAAPNTTADTKRSAAKYNNIVNIINRDDFIAKLLPEAWGYGRYGKTYVLPENATDAFLTTYQTVCGTTYQYNETAVKSIDEYLSGITSYVTNNDDYYNKSLLTGESSENEAKSLYNLYSKAFGPALGGNIDYVIMLDVKVGNWGALGTASVDLFSDSNVLASIVSTHGAGTYASKMNAYKKSDLVSK